jgi:hypothetical protein
MDYIDAASTFTSSVIPDHETIQLATPSPPHLKPPPILPTECDATTSIDPVELPTSETLNHPQTVLCPCCNDTMTLDHVCESVDEPLSATITESTNGATHYPDNPLSTTENLTPSIDVPSTSDSHSASSPSPLPQSAPADPFLSRIAAILKSHRKHTFETF